MNPISGKRPIHYAVDAEQYLTVEQIARVPNANLNVKFKNIKPLDIAIKKMINLNQPNFSHDILSLLIRFKINVNELNENGLTPIEIAIQHKNPKLIKMLLKSSCIDLDYHGNGEILKKLSPFLDINVPTDRIHNGDKWSYEKISKALALGDQNKFTYYINELTSNTDGFWPDKIGFQKILLKNAFQNQQIWAIKVIIRTGIEVDICERMDFYAKRNINYFNDNNSLIDSIQIFEHHNIYRDHYYDLAIELYTKVSHFDREFIDGVIYEINTIGKNKQTLLSLSTMYRNINCIKISLDYGSYIGSKYLYEKFGINPKLLEDHMNKCITTNHYKTDQKNFQIFFNYKNLIHTFDHNINESDSLEFISITKEFQHLMAHPLIASFLYFKWNQWSLLFYINFLCYSIFCMSNICYIMFYYRNDSHSIAMWTISVLFTLYICFREIFQLFYSPMNYLKNMENYLEMMALMIIAIILSGMKLSEKCKNANVSIVILIIMWEFFLLISSLPFLSFSEHFIMLRTVTYGFFKSLLLYSVILIAFALSFSSMFHTTKSMNDANQRNNDGNDTVNELSFDNFFLSTIKITVMMTGELDSSNIKFSLNPMSYLIFFIFIFFVTTILFNLLNGLAVYDIQVNQTCVKFFFFFFEFDEHLLLLVYRKSKIKHEL